MESPPAQTDIQPTESGDGPEPFVQITHPVEDESVLPPDVATGNRQIESQEKSVLKDLVDKAKVYADSARMRLTAMKINFAAVVIGGGIGIPMAVAANQPGLAGIQAGLFAVNFGMLVANAKGRENLKAMVTSTQTKINAILG